MRTVVTVLALVFLGCPGLPTVAWVDPRAPAPAHGGAAQDAGPRPDAGNGVGPTCFPEIWHPELINPEYDPFHPRVGSHCLGTNHQDIRDVERLVFLGDSVTAGTPPTLPAQLYRARVTEGLRARFGAGLEVSDCSRVGARSRDFFSGDNAQLPPCFPHAIDSRRTLVVFTMGGNDFADMTRAGSAGAPMSEMRPQAEATVAAFEAALRWLKDPARFPSGSDVIFANIYEYTDGTGDVLSCPGARLLTITERWPDGPEILLWTNSQLMRVAVETGADLLFLQETFCGHGFHNTDSAARCYRGPGTERWFDLTCIHPTPTGHGVLADMFLAVVDE
ncbi:MAG: SGNH/GDSL hydrolase family protein [Deltaproteobacteria bacterium]|nr:SGNH/GDSL hydrolase family protein [Deltaproteobacteria bacterium]